MLIIIYYTSLFISNYLLPYVTIFPQFYEATPVWGSVQRLHQLYFNRADPDHFTP